MFWGSLEEIAYFTCFLEYLPHGVKHSHTCYFLVMCSTHLGTLPAELWPLSLAPSCPLSASSLYVCPLAPIAVVNSLPQLPLPSGGHPSP